VAIPIAGRLPSEELTWIVVGLRFDQPGERALSASPKVPSLQEVEEDQQRQTHHRRGGVGGIEVGQAVGLNLKSPDHPHGRYRRDNSECPTRQILEGTIVRVLSSDNAAPVMPHEVLPE
jgi:hypothetical protein